MHAHRIAHLDISIRNTLTDNKQRYACIDFELSRRFDMASPRIRCLRATEPPTEVERGESCDPYKIDVWASGMLMLKAFQVSEHAIRLLLKTHSTAVDRLTNSRDAVVHHAFTRRGCDTATNRATSTVCNQQHVPE